MPTEFWFMWSFVSELCAINFPCDRTRVECIFLPPRVQLYTRLSSYYVRNLFGLLFYQRLAFGELEWFVGERVSNNDLRKCLMVFVHSNAFAHRFISVCVTTILVRLKLCNCNNEKKKRKRIANRAKRAQKVVFFSVSLVRHICRSPHSHFAAHSLIIRCVCFFKPNFINTFNLFSLVSYFSLTQSCACASVCVCGAVDTMWCTIVYRDVAQLKLTKWVRQMRYAYIVRKQTQNIVHIARNTFESN